MTLMARFHTIVRAEMTSLVARFEDPEKILHQLIVDMEEALADAKRGAALAIADEKRLGEDVAHHERETAFWRARAVEAARRGDETGARKALTESDRQADLARKFKAQHEQQKEDARKLRDAVQDLKQKIDEAKSRRNLLVARLKRSRAQRDIYRSLRGLSESSAFDAFERMDERVREVEAEAEAASELDEVLSQNGLRRELEDAERARRVEEELRGLMGGSAAAGAGA
jgi:phage shock protein A